MKTRQIVFTRPNTAEILEKDIQPPTAGQVQVGMLCSTISSGTERANLSGDANVSPGGNAVPFPRMLGYSSAGVVQQVGEGVSSLKAGDRVAMAWTVHSQLVNVPEACAYPLPGSVSFSDGALFHIAAFPLAALRKCRLEIGESAVVMGQGVLGLTSDVARLLNTAEKLVFSSKPLAVAWQNARLASGYGDIDALRRSGRGP